MTSESQVSKQHCFPKGIEFLLSQAARYVLKTVTLSTCGAMLCVGSCSFQTSDDLRINLQSTRPKGSALLASLLKLWVENEIMEPFTFFWQLFLFFGQGKKRRHFEVESSGGLHTTLIMLTPIHKHKHTYACL